MSRIHTDNVEELVYLCRQNNEEALGLLVERFRPYLSSWIRDHAYLYEGLALDRQDLLAHADVCLVESIERYREDLNAGFSTFYHRAVHNLFVDLARSKKRSRQAGIYEACSLDGLLKDGAGITILDQTSHTGSSLHEQTLRRLDIQARLQAIKEQLGDKALYIASLKSQGYTLKKMAEMSGLSIKQVRTILDKMKNIAASVEK